MEDNTILVPSLGVHVTSKSSMSRERPHKTKSRVRHNNEVDSTITSTLLILLISVISPRKNFPSIGHLKVFLVNRIKVTLC